MAVLFLMHSAIEQSNASCTSDFVTVTQESHDVNAN